MKDLILHLIRQRCQRHTIRKRLEIGLVSLEKTSWHFGFAQEAGFSVDVGEANLLSNVRYNYVLKATGIIGEKQAWSYLGFNIGFAWANRYY